MGSSVQVASGGPAPDGGAEFDPRLPPGTLDTLARLQAQCGDLYRLSTRNAATDTFIVAHPELATEVLLTRHRDFRRVMLDGRLPLVLGKGLLTSHGDHWKAQRKLLQRYFHGDALNGLIALAAPASARLAERWAQQARAGGSIELTRAVLRGCRDANLLMLFGEDAQGVAAAFDEDFFDRLGSAPATEDTRASLAFLRQVERLRACIGELIDARRGRTACGDDLLDRFARARQPDGAAMPPRQVVDEALTILAAGHETIAAALTAAWYLLSAHPRVQDAVRGEVDAVCGGAAPRAGHVAALRTTAAVLKEAMRLFPPVWCVSRVADVPSQIGGRPVPQGSHVLVVLYLIHRHPGYWRDPEAFDPQRFLADTEVPAWLAFSRGPRHCIGDELSMLHMPMQVAHVMQRVSLLHASGAPGDYAAGFALRSRVPIHVRPVLNG